MKNATTKNLNNSKQTTRRITRHEPTISPNNKQNNESNPIEEKHATL
jgi:hypothetical protein